MNLAGNFLIFLEYNLTILTSMKKILLLITGMTLLLHAHAQEFEGIEKGDKELSFYANLSTVVGIEDYSYASGNVNVSYGVYLAKIFNIGIAPGLSVSTSNGNVNVDFSGSVFMNLNFSSTKRTFGFFRASYYQSTFDVDDMEDFLAYAYAQAGLGFKSFFNENLAWETILNYGLNLDNPEIGNINLTTGVTIKF